jgi:hypothetical protein
MKNQNTNRPLLTDEEMVKLLSEIPKKDSVYYNILQELILTGEHLKEIALRHPELNRHGFGLWLSAQSEKIIGRSIVAHDIRKKVYWWALNPYYERYIDESDEPLKWGKRSIEEINRDSIERIMLWDLIK